MPEEPALYFTLACIACITSSSYGYILDPTGCQKTTKLEFFLSVHKNKKLTMILFLYVCQSLLSIFLLINNYKDISRNIFDAILNSK